MSPIAGTTALLVFAWPAWPQATASSTNVALGKSYTCSSPGGIAWQGLLDGEKTSDKPPGCFATGPDAEYPKKIVIDLGAVYLLEQVVVHSSANGNTKKMDVWASRDGVSYQQLRGPYVFPNKTAQRMSAKFPPLEARYVKLAFWDTYGGGLAGDHILYLREVEVIGREVPATAATRKRPELPAAPPRLVRVFRRYVFAPDRPVRLLVIGDDMALGQGTGKGLAAILADDLADGLRLESVRVDDRSETGLTARRAAALSFSADRPPDLVVLALGAADALAFDPATFRASMGRLLDKLLDQTEALVVAVVPPHIPHSADLGRADECGSANTADPAWQIAGLLPGRDIAALDAEVLLQQSGLPVTTAYADNLSLTDSGHEVIASAIVKLLHEP